MTLISPPLGGHGQRIERPGRASVTTRRRSGGTGTRTALAAADLVPDGIRRSLVAVARDACVRVAPADGAGVTVLLGGGLVHAGSDARADAVEDVQHVLGEGPGLAALAERSTVRSAVVDAAERRWPRFAERAQALAVRGVVSVPLVAGDDRLGALTFYYSSAEGLKATGEADLHGAVSTALQSLLDVRLSALLVESVRFLDAARRDRAEVDLAVGLLADRYGFTANHALMLVVQLARQDGLSTAAAARALTGRVEAP